jgi:hypothetical protein
MPVVNAKGKTTMKSIDYGDIPNVFIGQFGDLSRFKVIKKQ